jgi:hypothetical protein
MLDPTFRWQVVQRDIDGVATVVDDGGAQLPNSSWTRMVSLCLFAAWLG